MTMVIKVDRGRRRTRLSKEREAEEGGDVRAGSTFCTYLVL